MLNLQTITEQLARRIAPVAWVFVTSGRSPGGITKQMNERRSTGFSKIQGASRQIELSTEEVTDVIARRLLTKSEQRGARPRCWVCASRSLGADDELGTVLSTSIASMMAWRDAEVGREGQHWARRSGLTHARSLHDRRAGVLLLVRYVGPLQACRVTVLLRRSLGEDAASWRARVDRALRTLSDQCTMQRQVGGTYAYMTNEEKRSSPRDQAESLWITGTSRICCTDIRKHVSTSAMSFVYPGRIVAWACRWLLMGRERATETAGNVGFHAAVLAGR